MLEAWGSFTGAFVGEIQFQWIPEPLLVAKDIRNVAGALEDMSQPILAAQGIARGDIAERFATKTTPEGTAWAPWSTEYTTGNELGVLTGETEGAATSEGAFPITAHEVFFDMGAVPFQGQIFHHGRPGHGVSETEVSALAKEVGISHKRARAAILTEGGTGGGEQPAREFAGISEDAQIRIIDAFDIWFASAIAGFYVHAGGAVQTRLPSGRFGPKA